MLATGSWNLAIAQAAGSVTAQGSNHLVSLPMPLNLGFEPQGAFLVALDEKGTAFGLDPQRKAIFDLSSSDGAKLTRDLELSTPLRQVRMAAVAHGGEDWLLLEGFDHVRWIRGGEEQPVPPVEWVVSAVALDRGAPLVAVSPFAFGPPAGADATDPVGNTGLERDETPLVLRLDGKRWENVVPRAKEDEWSKETIRRAGLRGSLAWLLPRSNGGFYYASCGAYRVRQFSAGGAQKSELRVGEGRFEFAPPSPREQDALAKALETSGRDRSKSSAPRLRRILDGGIEGSDGNLYLLVRTDGGLALDRYSPGSQSVSRADLDFEPDGRMQLAERSDGLYLLPVADWRLVPRRISWESLEQFSHWQPIELNTQ